jgi:hypothetical protein
MIRHTTNLAERAASIADREAEEVWRRTGSLKEYCEAFRSIYGQALREFACPEDVQPELKP